jgi:hypothetical protein
MNETQKAIHLIRLTGSKQAATTICDEILTFTDINNIRIIDYFLDVRNEIKRA